MVRNREQTKGNKKKKITRSMSLELKDLSFSLATGYFTGERKFDIDYDNFIELVKVVKNPKFYIIIEGE